MAAVRSEPPRPEAPSRRLAGCSPPEAGASVDPSCQELGAAELARVLGTSEEPVLLDVREPDEVATWSIPRILNIPLGELADRWRELPDDRTVVVICASGQRSGRATRFLRSMGRDARNLAGGMAAWGRVYDTASFEAGGATVIQVRRRAKGCLSYVVAAGDEAFVVDPSVEVEVYTRLGSALGWRITRVFDTHLHADHLSGARELSARTGASLHLNPADHFEFDYLPLADGESFPLPGGAEMSVAVLHTPGHTEGSTIYFVGPDAMLSGDTLFVDGVGRPDLAERAEEFARSLHSSLHEKVLVLDDSVQVLPAHYGESVDVLPDVPVGASLGELRTSLPPLALSREGFVEWACSRVIDKPPHYVEIIKTNMGRSAISPEAVHRLEAGPNRCSA